MKCPLGYSLANPNMVCKLRKSLYGLKQAPRACFENFQSTFYSANFTKVLMITFLLCHSHGGIIILLLYVDDMVITDSAITKAL